MIFWGTFADGIYGPENEALSPLFVAISAAHDEHTREMEIGIEKYIRRDWECSTLNHSF